MSVVTCPQCGAAPERREQSFCGYCGTALPEPERGDDPRARERRLLAEAEERIPDVLARPTRRARATTPPGSVAKLAFGLVFAGAAVAMIQLQQSIHAPRGGLSARHVIEGLPVETSGPSFDLFVIVPALFVLIGLGMAAFQAWTIVRFRGAPLRGVAVIVRDERTRVSGGGENSQARTSYYATVEDHRGARREYPVTGSLAGELSAGDVGVALVRGDHLLDLVRVRTESR